MDLISHGRGGTGLLFCKSESPGRHSNSRSPWHPRWLSAFHRAATCRAHQDSLRRSASDECRSNRNINWDDGKVAQHIHHPYRLFHSAFLLWNYRWRDTFHQLPGAGITKPPRFYLPSTGDAGKMAGAGTAKCTCIAKQLIPLAPETHAHAATQRATSASIRGHRQSGKLAGPEPSPLTAPDGNGHGRHLCRTQHHSPPVEIWGSSTHSLCA